MRKKNTTKANKNNIVVKGARVNNLKNIDVKIPRNKFVVITGLSGSGKSSLAFNTIYKEGNRRYMEGVSSYARSFLNVASKPDVDSIENLSPTISIDQKSVGRSPRSTVGTLTEIYDYLRILFAHLGEPHCPECGFLMRKKSVKEILAEIMTCADSNNFIILAPYTQKNKSIKDILIKIKQFGYARVRLNKKILTIDEALSICDDDNSWQVEIVVDRIILDPKHPDKERIMDSLETAIKLSEGLVIVNFGKKKEELYSRDYFCEECSYKMGEISPRHFSFNNPEGSCPECAGLGVKMRINPKLVIPNKKLSLDEGAIKPWGNVFLKDGTSKKMELLRALAKKYNFSLQTSVNKLTAKQLKIILFGADNGDNELFLQAGIDGAGMKYLKFSGVIAELEKKYKTAKTDYTRKKIEKYMTTEICPVCQGKRLNKNSLNVLIYEKSIDDWVAMSIASLREFTSDFLEKNKNKKKKQIIKLDKPSLLLLKEIKERLEVLEDVGLGYLSLKRGTQTISGGEAQRLRLAVQIKSQLSGIIYVLDEPSTGLHNRDNRKLIQTIRYLRDLGNSLIVVEHDRDFIKSADWIIDMGPKAGDNGGKVIFSGTRQKLLKTKNKTALYLNGKKEVYPRTSRSEKIKKYLEIVGASEHNLKNINVKIPLERMVVVCGVSGSGKSTLVNDILARSLSQHFYRSEARVGEHKDIKGIDNIDKVINVTQNPIGKTPRSNAATYTGVFYHIREIFAQTEEAKERKYTASRFSFNMKGGRCEVCQGDGQKKIEMQLLPDMYVKCESCGGTRYNKKTLEIEYQGANIADVLKMTVSYAMLFFKKHKLVYEKLKAMDEVGLGYLKLGQSAVDLSGGEAQRIKLATELARKSTGKTLYILDEPTVGLHFNDIHKLMQVCDALVEKGNSVLIVEHNSDVIKSVDWVVELGPEGGAGGGKIVFAGTPEKLKKNKKSWTGKYL